jgi:hypothetical protein
MAHQLAALAAKTESLTQSVYQVLRDPAYVPEPLLLAHRLGLADAELAVSSHASVV